MTGPAGGACDPTSFTIDPLSIAVVDLVPGRAQDHDVRVENLGADPVAVTAQVLHTDGPLFGGSTPLQVTVTTTAGDPAVVAPGADVDLTVTALLPVEADNAYAGLDGSAVIRVLGTALCTDEDTGDLPGAGTPSAPGVPGTSTPGAAGSGGPAGDGVLALTGPGGALTALLLATALLALGALARRRRTEDRP